MALILSGSIDAGGSANRPQFLGSASYAATASFALNGGGGATVDTSSLLTTASVATNVVTFTKGDASTFDITVQTGSIPAGTISGSAQLPADIVSSSAQTIANLSGTDIISGSAQLPAGLVSSSVQVSDITASSIINAETSSTAQANEIVFTKGDGTTFNITQDTSSFVKTVNAASPDANGNVAVSITSVESGTSSSMLAASSSGALNEGDVWVVAGESGSLSGSNGEAYIYSDSDGLLSISPSQQGVNDQRYVFKFGDTMTGQLILNGSPTNVLGAAPKQYVDPAYTGSLITSSSLGVNTLTLRTRGGATETHTFNSSSYAVTASHAATASFVTSSNVQGPHGANSVVTASYALVAGSGGGGDIATPVITGIVTQSIEQGDSATFSGLAIQSGNPAMWAVQNTGVMTASLGTTNNISTTNTVTTNDFSITGSFTSSLYALTALGRSVANELLVNVAEFNLTSSNVFGNDLSKYYLQVETDASIPQTGDNAQYVYWGNGVVNDTTEVLDVENTTITGIDTTEYALWYNESAERLFGYQYTSAGTLNAMVTVEVADFANKTTNQAVVAKSSVTTNEKLGGKLFGKYGGTGFYQLSTPQSDFYLQISGSGGLLNSFGTNGQGDWMYGFNLLDDWTIGNSGLQMLAPDDAGTGKAFVQAYGAYFITSTETDFLVYGDSSIQADTTSGISWSSTNGVMAPSGSSIIVWFDDSANTTYVYVDGTQEVADTTSDTYMGTTATVDPVLHFGNPVNRNLNDYTSERFVINFPYRINNLWIATAGTSLTSANVAELSSHANISDSTNYASIDFHSQEITTTPDKGAAVLSRKSFTRPTP